MKWLLWLILILLVIGILWWFFNRNRSTQSGSSATSAGGDSSRTSHGFSEPAAGGTAAAGASATDSAPADPIERDLHSADTPPAPADPTTDDLHSAETPPPADPTTDDLHSADTPPPAPLDEPVGFVSSPDDGSRAADAPAESAVADEPAPVDDTPLATESATAAGAAGGPAATDLHSATTSGKFGAGSADPGPDGSGPAGWTIKGNEDSMKYHTEDSPWYERTVAEVWFDGEERAAAAGFKRWDDRS